MCWYGVDPNSACTEAPVAFAHQRRLSKFPNDEVMSYVQVSTSSQTTVVLCMLQGPKRGHVAADLATRILRGHSHDMLSSAVKNTPS